MKILKIFVFAILSSSFYTNAAAQPANGGRNKISERKPPQTASDETNIKTIADGASSPVTTPFVFVARTPETYKLLRTLVENLPNEAVDFNRTAIVAAFAGEKNTGGYSLEIAGKADKLSVKIVAPPSDAIIAQFISSPYKIVAVAVEPHRGVNLDLPADFVKASKNYRLTAGKFQSSGEGASAKKSFIAEGTVRVLSFGDAATLVFNLTGKSKSAVPRLFETASGELKAGKIILSRVEAADFIDRPHPPLAATGNLNGRKLVLAFATNKSGGGAVEDGFSGGGKLEAVLIK